MPPQSMGLRSSTVTESDIYTLEMALASSSFFRAGFFNLGILPFGAGKFSVVVLCVLGWLSSILGLYSLEANGIPSPVVRLKKNVSRCYQMSPRGQHHLQLRTTASDEENEAERGEIIFSGPLIKLE